MNQATDSARIAAVSASERPKRDFGVHFRGAVYPVEVKKASLYAKSHEEAYRQVAKYINRLGMSEGWLVVADPDLAKPWEEKIGLKISARVSK